MAELIEFKSTKARARPIFDPVRNCDTCGHRTGGSYATFGKCMLSGHYCTTERMYPTRCGLHFEGWTARPPQPPGLWARIWSRLTRS